MKKTVIIYKAKNNESLVAKNRCKKKNPKATVIESSNTEVLKEALKGTGTEVYNFDKDLDLRKLKGEKVKANTKKNPAAKKKVVAKKPAKKKVAKKAPAKKKPAAKKDSKK